jgi:GT2 family glycosyltransferase
MSGPALSVVVLSWNTRELTLACLRALAADSPKHSREVVVIDNDSSDGSADAIAAAFPRTVLARNSENLLYAGGNNQGARLATGRWLCLLNSDTEVRPGALDMLVDWLEAHPEYGAVGPRLCNPDGSVQRACMAFPGLFTALCFDTVLGRFPPGRWVEDHYRMRRFDHLHSRDVDQPPGACLLLDRREYLELGGLDEELALFFNDVDLCRRLWRRGRRIRYLAEAEVVHHGGASTKSFQKFVVIWHRNRMAYYRKHFGGWVDGFMRLCVRMRAAEEAARIRLRTKDPGRRRAERDHLRTALQEILAP